MLRKEARPSYHSLSKPLGGYLLEHLASPNLHSVVLTQGEGAAAGHAGAAWRKRGAKVAPGWGRLHTGKHRLRQKDADPIIFSYL